MTDMSRHSVGGRRSKGVPVSMMLCLGVIKEGILSIKTSYTTTIVHCPHTIKRKNMALTVDFYVL